VASTTALPPPTCTARQEAGQLRLLAVVLLRGLYRPNRLQLLTSRRVPVGSSAGCVCLQRLSSAGCVCLPTFAMPYLLPSSSFSPFCFVFPAPVHYHVRQDRRPSLQGLPCWQLQHGPAVAARAPVGTFDFYLFPAESIDPGPWLV